MRENVLEILSQLRGGWRFRWVAVGVAWAIALAGWLAVGMMPNEYQARAKIFVDTDSVLKPLLAGLAVATDPVTQVNMMSRALMTRPHLEKVARETDLALRAKTPESFQRLIDSMPTRIGIGGGQGNIYSITFEDADPQMAYRVVRKLADTFVEDSIGNKRDDTAGAQRFLTEQLSDYERKLREAEDRLANFKKENLGLMPGQTGDYYARRQTVADDLAKLRSQYSVVEQRRDELRRQLEGEEPTFGLVNPTTPAGRVATVTDAKIAEFQKQLDQLLLQYTDKHPRVVALRETIEQLRKQAPADPVPEASAPVDPTRLAARMLDVNPVYQSMKINLSQTELELVELRNKISQAQSVTSDLQGKVNTIPEVEAQLARLNRDYEVNRTQYQALLQRLESARLSEQADDSQEHVKFRIIEPPTVPLVAQGPNRHLLSAGVFAAALLGGLAAAFILSQIRPVFSTRQALINAAGGIPVLGMINLAQVTQLTKSNIGNAKLIGAIAGLAALFGVVVVFSDRGAALLATLVR
jgi:polysaccharide chain length determinant protein (PEP-CTERM system associated)